MVAKAAGERTERKRPKKIAQARVKTRKSRDSNVYAQGDDRSAASKFGQIIGEAFQDVVYAMIKDCLTQQHPEYELLEPEEGSSLVKLAMLGGSTRQLDTVIAAKNSDDPVGLLEAKWLKDARHHNDKGAWILQLREIKKSLATVRGLVAVLAGYWTEGVGIMLLGEGGVRMVHVATDAEVYDTLQKPFDDFMGRMGKKTFAFDPDIMRQSYPHPSDLANFITDLRDRGELKGIAVQWLEFQRDQDAAGKIITGNDRIKQAINTMLAPLPSKPRIEQFEIALQIDSGNTVYKEFKDYEEALEFVREHYENPMKLLEIITPKKRTIQRKLEI